MKLLISWVYFDDFGVDIYVEILAFLFFLRKFVLFKYKILMFLWLWVTKPQN